MTKHSKPRRRQKTSSDKAENRGFQYYSKSIRSGLGSFFKFCKDHSETIRPEEYGENPMNWGMVQNNKGMIYVANLNGILEFDGVSWRGIKTSNDGWVLSVAVDSTGTVFAGSFGDFGYLAPDSIGNLQFVS